MSRMDAEDLQTAVRKATKDHESFPKQKHIRKCIVHTWDVNTSKYFWTALKSVPFLTSEVSCYKALVTIHKVVRQGHPNTLKESLREKEWIKSIPSLLSAPQRGYKPLIHGYSNYILCKLVFHSQNPDFNGTFDYTEYVSLKGTNDVNECYETLTELIGLVEKLDEFQKSIFNSRVQLTACKISPMIPLIEESYGIYLFLLSMLRALHKVVGSLEALEVLRQGFHQVHNKLKEFYDEARKYKNITSIITVPKLSDVPSLFDSDVIPAAPVEIEIKPVEPKVEKTDFIDTDTLLRMLNEKDALIQALQQQILSYQQQIASYQQQIASYQQQLASAQSGMYAIQQMQNKEDPELQKKYDALATLYAALRKEHLNLLNRQTNEQEQISLKTKEIDALKSGLDQALIRLSKQRPVQNQQMEMVLDAILMENIVRVDQAYHREIHCTPEHALSLIDMALNQAAMFSDAFQAHIVSENYADVIQKTNEFGFCVSSLMEKAQASHFPKEIEVVFEQFQNYYNGLKSTKLINDKSTKVAVLHKNFVSSLNNLAEKMEIKQPVLSQPIAALESEMQNTEQVVSNATQKLKKLMDSSLQVHEAILSHAMSMVQATNNLIRCSALCQREILETENTPTTFYKKNNRWSQGLLSAAKAIAAVTTLLVECADGLVSGTRTAEEVAVAAKEVSAATAQLMAASRVRAIQGSKHQANLEIASSNVTKCAQQLVLAAHNASQKQKSDEMDKITQQLLSMSTHDLKTKEMDQQVKILTMEKELSQARRILGAMRQSTYNKTSNE